MDTPMASKPEEESAVRAYLMRWVHSGTESVAAWQRWFGVKNGKPTNPILHAIFHVGATMGNELWFITFLPFLFWEWNMGVARKIIYLWVSQYYIGHYLKDTLQLPRPSGGGVVPLERHYEHEYGMPSTHGMNAVSMPWYMVYLSLSRYTGSLPLLLAFASFWTLSCVFSRLYLGVHSPADLWVGMAHGASMLLLHVAYGDNIDHFVLTTRYWWAVAMVLTVLAALAYPRPERPAWVPTPGDTVLIVATTAGITIAANAAPHAHMMASHTTFHGPDWTVSAYGHLVKRLVVGFAFLMLIRAVSKAACMAVLPRLVSTTYGSADDLSIQPHLDGKKVEMAAGGMAAVGSVSPPAIDTSLRGGVPGGDDDDTRHAAPTEPDAAASTTTLRQRSVGKADPDSEFTMPPPPSPSAARALSTLPLRDGPTASIPPFHDDGASQEDDPAALHMRTATTPHTACADPARVIPTPTSSRASVTGVAASAKTPRPGGGLVPIHPTRRYAVELPTKIITYSMVGFNAVYTIPCLYQWLGWKDYGMPVPPAGSPDAAGLGWLLDPWMGPA